ISFWYMGYVTLFHCTVDCNLRSYITGPTKWSGNSESGSFRSASNVNTDRDRVVWCVKIG
ncbi:hypothetical protein J6590_089604, partial [Homalodisca vitripennis]